MSFKIRVTSEMKKVLTVAEMSSVREIQKEFSSEDNTETLAYYCKMIAELFGEYSAKIFEPHAEIAKNERAYDAFGIGTGNLDVWIECYIFGHDVCGKFGACITDLWNISSDIKDSNEEVKKYVYAEIYQKNK